VTRHRPPLLPAALARVGTGAAWTRILEEAPVKITHPVPGYTGPVRGPVRLDFVNGTADATGIKPAVRRALEDAGFTVESTRAAKADTEADDEP
jgi:hypothetical protein